MSSISVISNCNSCHILPYAQKDYNMSFSILSLKIVEYFQIVMINSSLTWVEVRFWVLVGVCASVTNLLRRPCYLGEQPCPSLDCLQIQNRKKILLNQGRQYEFPVLHRLGICWCQQEVELLTWVGQLLPPRQELHRAYYELASERRGSGGDSLSGEGQQK